jgi:hypothetical protein
MIPMIDGTSPLKTRYISRDFQRALPSIRSG